MEYRIIDWNKIMVPVAMSIAVVGILILVPQSLGDMQDEEQKDQEKIEKLIEQLNDSSLTKRAEARQKLREFGQSAIGPLTAAALSDKRELITQSIEILADMKDKSTDEATANAAKVALETLAESEKPSTADRAKLALNSEKDGGIKAFPGWDKPNSEFNGNMGAGMNRSVSVSSVNGVKTITVKENGLTTVIQDLAGGKIGVEKTGGEKPIKFVAKNLDDLKKKDESAFAIYQQQGNGMQMRGFEQFGNLLGQTGNGNRGNAEAIAIESNNQTTGDTATLMLIQQLTQMKQRMPENKAMQNMLDKQIADLKAKLKADK